MTFDYIIGGKESQIIGSSLKRPKYNYKKASAIWDRLIDITYDMPDYLDLSQRQYERRYFLRMLTRYDNHTKNGYLDWIAQFIIDMDYEKTDKNRIELEKIALEIVFFTN